MKRKRIILVVSGLVGLSIGAYFVQGYRLRSEVDRLIGEAHGRGIKTDLQDILLPRSESGTMTVKALAGIVAHRELRRLRFDDSNIVNARKLVASATDEFDTIAEFAGLEVYAPRRELSAGMVAQDYSTLAGALHAEAWRGYLLAVDGEFDQAVQSTRILTGFIERLQDEGLPVGHMIGQRGHLGIQRIVLKLAQSNSRNAERIDRLIAVSRAVPMHDFRSIVQFELASNLLLIDEVQQGKLESSRPVSIGPLQFRFARTPQALDHERMETLRVSIEAYDSWDTAPLDPVDPGDARMVRDDLLLHLTPAIRSLINYNRRIERHDIANRRALSLTLEAYSWRAKHGKLPSVVDLDAEGIEAKDPWTGDLLTLHEAEKGRIWVGAMRPNPKAMPPRKPELVDVLAWRP